MSFDSPKQSAVAFLTLVASGQVDEAYDRYIGPGFRHHNPWFEGDAESLKAAMKSHGSENPEKVLEVKRALEDGDFVAVFSHIRQNRSDRGAAVVHIFRFEHGRIVELWDVGQEVPEEGVNELGMF